MSIFICVYFSTLELRNTGVTLDVRISAGSNNDLIRGQGPVLPGRARAFITMGDSLI